MDLKGNTKQESYGCLVSAISLWLVVDVALGVGKITLGAWIMSEIKETITLCSILIALG